jgi:hypothetical protein
MIKTLGRIAAALSIAACVSAFAQGQSANASQWPTAGAGEHQVVVPFDALKDVIRPDGPLARFVK